MTWNGGMLGPFRGRGGYNSSSNNNSGFGKHVVFNNKKCVINFSISAVIYQICFKPKYITGECRNKYNKEFVPSYPPPSYNLYQTSTPRATQLTTCKDEMADQGWYLDSSATYHLTNNLQNLNHAIEYSGNQLLHVGNGEGLKIPHIGYTGFKYPVILCCI